MTQTASEVSPARASWPVSRTPAVSRDASPCEPSPQEEPLQDSLSQLARELGFQGAVYVHLGHAVRAISHAGAVVPLRFVASSVFDRRLYLETGALEVDAQLARAVRTNTPYVWTTAHDPRNSEGQRQLNARLRGRGIQAGVAAPVQDFAAGPAYVSFYSAFAGEAERGVRERAASLAFAAGDFHIRAKGATPTLAQAARPLLTSREIDCLRLAALGLTAQETATALDVTVRTVEFHLKNAAEKFGACNKVRAVALAVSQGLIEV
jgi:DNA-binding CsgD family transcriptional regulator